MVLVLVIIAVSAELLGHSDVAHVAFWAALILVLGVIAIVLFLVLVAILVDVMEHLSRR